MIAVTGEQLQPFVDTEVGNEHIDRGARSQPLSSQSPIGESRTPRAVSSAEIEAGEAQQDLVGGPQSSGITNSLKNLNQDEIANDDLMLAEAPTELDYLRGKVPTQVINQDGAIGEGGGQDQSGKRLRRNSSRSPSQWILPPSSFRRA